MSLPTAEETALGNTVTQSANAAVLREVQAEPPRKHKPYTVFTAEQRATIGKYASEHGNAAAVKKFKVNIEGGQLEERFHCTHKACYQDDITVQCCYLNEGCKGRAHCLSAMFDPSKELVHEVQVWLASELNQSVKS